MLGMVYEWIVCEEACVWDFELQSFYCCMYCSQENMDDIALILMIDWIACECHMIKAIFENPSLAKFSPKVLEILYPFWTLALNSMWTLVLKFFTLSWDELNCMWWKGSSLGLYGGKLKKQVKSIELKCCEKKNSWEKEKKRRKAWRWAQWKRKEKGRSWEWEILVRELCLNVEYFVSSLDSRILHSRKTNSFLLAQPHYKPWKSPFDGICM